MFWLRYSKAMSLARSRLHKPTTQLSNEDQHHQWSYTRTPKNILKDVGEKNTFLVRVLEKTLKTAVEWQTTIFLAIAGLVAVGVILTTVSPAQTHWGSNSQNYGWFLTSLGLAVGATSAVLLQNTRRAIWLATLVSLTFLLIFQNVQNWWWLTLPLAFAMIIFELGVRVLGRR